MRINQPAPVVARIALDYLEYVGIFTLVCLMGAVANYPVTALSTGFADAHLERVDHLFHFDWLA